MVDDQNVDGVNEGAKNDKSFTFSNSADAAAKEIRPCEGKSDGNPVKECNLLFDKNAQKGDDDDIQGSQKACFSGGGIL